MRCSALHDAIADADAVLVATPEYNHSIPGQLKNALDWLSRPLADSPLRNKPAAVVGASTGLFGAVWAQAEARKVLAAIGARVIDRELPVGMADDAFTPDGALADEDLSLALAGILAELRRRTRPTPAKGRTLSHVGRAPLAQAGGAFVPKVSRRPSLAGEVQLFGEAGELLEWSESCSTDATISCVEALVCCVVADICSADAAVSSA